jgi:hypothetical protein
MHARKADRISLPFSMILFRMITLFGLPWQTSIGDIFIPDMPPRIRLQQLVAIPSQEVVVALAQISLGTNGPTLASWVHAGALFWFEI